VRHVRAHDRQREVRDHPAQLLGALRARGDLRAQVREVLLDVARG
jgi:hypothetical protein